MRLNYYIRFSILTIGLAVLAATLFTTILQPWYFNAMPAVLLLIAGATLLFHRLMIKYLQKGFRVFQSAFMLGTSLKLMLYLAVIVVYILIFNHHPLAFTATFLFFYLVYTLYETRELLNISKNHRG